MSGIYPYIEDGSRESRIRRGFPARYKGRLHSRKTGESVWWESFLEAAMSLVLEHDPDVVTFRSQPFRLFFLRQHVERRYTPDFLVRRQSATRGQVIEVKPLRKQQDPEFRQIMAQVAVSFAELGYDFHIVGEKDLGSRTYLSNLRLLQRYADVAVSGDETRRIVEAMEATGEIELQGLIERCPIPDALRKIYRLLWDQKLRCELEQPLSGKTVVLS